MKKKTVNLLNSLKTIVETSYPGASKKIQKQILEDFIYDSMMNQLNEWTDHKKDLSDFVDLKTVRSMARSPKDREDMEDYKSDMRNDPLARSRMAQKADGKGLHTLIARSALNQLGREIDGEDTGSKSLKDTVMDNPGITAAVTAVAALTGWGLTKAYKFVKEKGPEGVEMLKKQVKPSMMDKIKSRFKNLKASVGLAESYIYNNPSLKKKKSK